ncbi:MAG: Ni/Fe hydrogenase subunit gamma, partial [Gemmatimonadota bacterium]
MVPEPWRVLSAHQEAPGVVTLEMEPLSGEPPRFRPGQFSMLYAFGVGEIPISVSGDCTDPSKV